MGFLLKKLRFFLTCLLLGWGLSVQAGGDHIPWPLGAEVPFPWSSVDQTVWQVQTSGGGSSIFLRLRVIGDNKDSKYLRIEQIDGESDRVIAVGAGVEEDFLVRAIMATNEGHLYRLVMFYYFDEETRAQGMGVTFLPFMNEGSDYTGYHYLMRQVDEEKASSFSSECPWWYWACRQ